VEEVLPNTPQEEIEPIPRGFSPWSDAASVSDQEEVEGRNPEVQKVPNISLGPAMTEVEQILSHLIRLALAIRKAGTNSRLQTADRHFDPKAPVLHDLRQHLEVMILARGSKHGRQSYGHDAAQLSLIQERLVISNLRRRNRFLYAQSQARKLANESRFMDGNRVRDQAPYASPRTDEASQTQGVRERNTSGLGVSAPLPGTGTPQMTPLTATSASAVEARIYPVPARSETQSQVAKTNITTTAARVKYPRPPRPKLGLRHFKCPCCCQVLPDMFWENTMWK
jgi:hypothetical protein